MSFLRFKKINCISAIDERSAGFIALGIAKFSRRPVAVICTSGSALVNIYPAVCEAYYSGVPLLVISADRPPEMIDRWDGQTIRQNGVFGSHILENASLEPSDVQFEQIRTLSSALFSKMKRQKGPVHLNIPLSEPLYSEAETSFSYDWNTPIEDERTDELEYQFPDLPKNQKVLLLLGADADLMFFYSEEVPVIADIISNSRQCSSLKSWENILLRENDEALSELVPDILITCGKMVLNKKLKELFRKNKPQYHVHIGTQGFVADTFFINPIHIPARPDSCLNDFISQLEPDKEYYKIWTGLNLKAESTELMKNNSVWSELNVFKKILPYTEEGPVLHLANSMSVRYAAWLSALIPDYVQIFSNRGVSGIDGCTSTAVGIAYANPEKKHLLITGDLALLYDANPFLGNIKPSNLKIVVMNNGGGGIFSMIPGPAKMPEHGEFMFTPHRRNLKYWADLNELNYYKAENFEQLQLGIELLLNDSCTSILDVQTDPQINLEVFKSYKSYK